MKKRILTITLLALVATSLFAQKFALQNAKDILLKTKDLKVTEQVSQQLRDSNDSLCTAEIIAFEMPFSRRDVFQKVQQEYSNELPHSSEGYSRVVDWDAEPRNHTEGVERVSLFHAEGREPITTGKGSNFVCLRNNLQNPQYRTVVCIEWWKDSLVQKVDGRIISIQGPASEEAYGGPFKYFGQLSYPNVKIIRQKKSESDPTRYNAALKYLDYSPIKVLSSLEKMYNNLNDDVMREAVLSSFGRQASSFIHQSSHDDEDMKEFLRLLDKMPGYAVEVLETETKADGTSQWKPQHMTTEEIIEKYESFPILCLSWCEKDSPETKAYGEVAKNGLLQIFLNK